MKQFDINSLFVGIDATLILVYILHIFNYISYCTAFCSNGSSVSFVNLYSGTYRYDNFWL